MPRLLAAVALVLVAAAQAVAQPAPRQDVVFQVNQATVSGQSVYVLGSLPELGSNDVRKAVRLEPSTYPLWKATVSLPASRTYTYQFVIRNNAAGQGGLSTNGSPVSAVFSASTDPAPSSIPGKLVLYHSGWVDPVLNWRQDQGAWNTTPMIPIERARSASETRWLARLPQAVPGVAIEYIITSEQALASGNIARDPEVGSYQTPLDASLLQDGSIYNYIPAAAVGVPRRAYSTSAVPFLTSSGANLGQSRPYRVFLPRGYDQHPWKRYPVLYMHDGQNIFEAGSFGSWNAAQTLTALQRSGTMREIIVVGVDNTSTRLNDYSPPDNGGRGDRYTRFLRDELKPLIDAQYRTIPTPDVTGSAGSSMGGMISLYQGWDYTQTFTRIGAFSGAWNIGWSTVINNVITSTAFYDRVRAQPTRAIRLYLDSGDSGTASDNYTLTYALRDNLLARAPSEQYALEGEMQHVVGFGQQHNEAAWSARLPGALVYLYPSSEEPNPLNAYWWARPTKKSFQIQLQTGGFGAQSGPGAAP